MILVLVILSVVFIGIGFFLTEENAKSLLSGYNTMSEEERKHFDIKAYIPYFRNFHVFLGTSLFALGIVFYYFINADWAGILLGTYPILAYIIFIWKSDRFNLQKTKKQRYKLIFVLGLLLIIFVGISYMFYSSLQDNPMEISAQEVKIGGDYGLELEIKAIKSVELLDSLPIISGKSNGFAMETIKKGYFSTPTGEEVKLLINSKQLPIIYIQLLDGKKIYYSSKEKPNQEIFQELKKVVKGE